MAFTRHRKKHSQDITHCIAAALLISICILLIRGFVMSVDKASKANDGVKAYQSVDISVYLHREEKTCEMDMEEYLVGVVAAEMPVSFEDEALKAQAVAARTFTARHLEAMGGTSCKKGKGEICSDSSCCQAYRSDEELKKNWGIDYDKNIEKVRSAVYETQGEIITYGGELIEALYHSNSGGMTEAAVNVFSQGRPYLVSVKSPDSSASHGEKSVEISKKEFVKKINSKWEDASLEESKLKKSVKIISRYEGGRIEKIKVGNVSVSGKDMRKLFSLDSANFTLEFTDDAVVITTYGFGHGVGMSQYGADAMASGGSSYSEILQHYYKNTEIVSM